MSCDSRGALVTSSVRFWASRVPSFRPMDPPCLSLISLERGAVSHHVFACSNTLSRPLWQHHSPGPNRVVPASHNGQGASGT